MHVTKKTPDLFETTSIITEFYSNSIVAAKTPLRFGKVSGCKAALIRKIRIVGRKTCRARSGNSGQVYARLEILIGTMAVSLKLRCSYEHE